MAIKHKPTTSPQQPSPPDGGVCVAVEEMASYISALSQDVANLQDHLAPVMRSGPEADDADDAVDSPNPGITPVSMTLFSLTAKLRGLQAPVRTIQNLVAL